MKSRWILVAVLTLLAVLLVTFKPLRLGLDLRGGTSLVLAVEPNGAELSAEVLDQTRRVVERRINAYGISEATVQPYGNARNRLLVKIPGSTADLARIRASLQHQGVLEWYAVAGGPFATEDAARQARTGALGERIFGGSEDGQGWFITRGSPVLRGSDLRSAQAVSEAGGGWATGFVLSNEAGARFGAFTSANVGKRVAIVLDGRVLSAGVIEEPIRSEGQIRNARGRREAEDLAILLRAGAVPAAVRVMEESTVAASLGEDSIRSGIAAAIAGVAAIVGALLLVYRRAGVNATATLLLNGLLLLALLVLFDAVLTLPGIAGLILTAGMAVDSNVLVFERIRELREGKPEAAAVHGGFERAWKTIFDTHVTTMVSCGLLFWFGTTAVQGFAVTLALGLLTNLFTAVYVSRLLFDWEMSRG